MSSIILCSFCWLTWVAGAFGTEICPIRLVTLERVSPVNLKMRVCNLVHEYIYIIYIYIYIYIAFDIICCLYQEH